MVHMWEVICKFHVRNLSQNRSSECSEREKEITCSTWSCCAISYKIEKVARGKPKILESEPIAAKVPWERTTARGLAHLLLSSRDLSLPVFYSLFVVHKRSIWAFEAFRNKVLQVVVGSIPQKKDVPMSPTLFSYETKLVTGLDQWVFCY